MAEHNELGKQGEEIAVRFLKKKGYLILARNYRFKHQEVDIISRKGELLIVVEVKTRQSRYLAGPEDTVTKSKQKSIIRVTNHYLHEMDLDIETRFDIISIILNKKERDIEHLVDAFYPLR